MVLWRVAIEELLAVALGPHGVSLSRRRFEVEDTLQRCCVVNKEVDVTYLGVRSNTAARPSFRRIYLGFGPYQSDPRGLGDMYPMFRVVFSLSSSWFSRGDPTRCSGCHSSPHLFLVGLHCLSCRRLVLGVFLRFLLLAYAMGVVVV
jgi:hypothetical protein